MSKPIFGMLHLSGRTADERLEIAGREIDMLVANGVDGLMVENYFGGMDDVQRVLDLLSERRPTVAIGLNVLRDFGFAFQLAESYPVDVIQIDSVAGHLPPEEDADFAAELSELRNRSRVVLLGGVRFKYKPVRSGRTEAQDLRLGAERADAIVVTGEATGMPTDPAKILRFRETLGASIPLLVGAGLTPRSAPEQLALVDGAIVGSYFKDAHVDTGLVHSPHVAELMTVVRSIRGEAAPSPAGSA